MRYCINCGAPMGDERFCDKCGTDNGAAQLTPAGAVGAASGQAVTGIDSSLLVHILSVASFAAAAIILLTICFKQAEMMPSQSMMYTGNAYFAFIFFAVGMWGCIPSLMLILNIKKKNQVSVVSAAIVMIAVMLAVLLINSIFENFNGLFKYLYLVAVAYKPKVTTVIILEVVTVVLGILSPRTSKILKMLK